MLPQLGDIKLILVGKKKDNKGAETGEEETVAHGAEGEATAKFEL